MLTCYVYHLLGVVLQTVCVHNNANEYCQNNAKLLYVGTFVDREHIVDQCVDQKERGANHIDHNDALLVGEHPIAQPKTAAVQTS